MPPTSQLQILPTYLPQSLMRGLSKGLSNATTFNRPLSDLEPSMAPHCPWDLIPQPGICGLLQSFHSLANLIP